MHNSKLLIDSFGFVKHRQVVKTAIKWKFITFSQNPLVIDLDWHFCLTSYESNSFKKLLLNFQGSFLLSYVNCRPAWRRVWRIWVLKLKTNTTICPSPPPKKRNGKYKRIFIVLQILYWSNLLKHIPHKGYFYYWVSCYLNYQTWEK